MRCERNYCDEQGTHIVHHDTADETVACRAHATWWVTGAYGVRLGTFRLVGVS